MSRFSLRPLACTALLALAGCRNPQADAYVAEQLRQMADELNATRQESAIMHEQLDSLRFAMAKQDTLLRQLAGMAGVPVASGGIVR